MKANQRIILTKRLLQEALLKILKKKSLDNISITELCNEAGINRATFYRHYNIPRDVILDMQTQFVENIHKKFDVDTFNKDPEAFVEQLCTVLYDNSSFIKLSIKNNLEDNIIKLSCDAFQKYLIDNNILNKKGLLDNDDIKLFVAYMSGGSYYLIRQWLMEDIKKSPKEISKTVLSVVDIDYMLKA